MKHPACQARLVDLVNRLGLRGRPTYRIVGSVLLLSLPQVEAWSSESTGGREYFAVRLHDKEREPVFVELELRVGRSRSGDCNLTGRMLECVHGAYTTYR